MLVNKNIIIAVIGFHFWTGFFIKAIIPIITPRYDDILVGIEIKINQILIVVLIYKNVKIIDVNPINENKRDKLSSFFDI